MSVMVYPRLGDLLRDKNVTVRDLQQRLAARFGLMVAVRTLDRLARADRVRRPDLELAAASAEVLGVGLSEIFAVETAVADKEVEPDADGLGDKEGDMMEPEQGDDRLSELFDLQDRRPLSADEQAEMRALTAEWAHQVNEQSLRSIAAKRGLPIEQVRADVAADLDRMIAWRRELDADPARLEALMQESWEKQRRASSTHATITGRTISRSLPEASISTSREYRPRGAQPRLA